MTDTLEEARENVEESLDDLLIFPTKKGLRRSMKKIIEYFTSELEVIKGMEVSEKHSQSTFEEQENIVNIAKRELNKSAQDIPKECESN